MKIPKLVFVFAAIVVVGLVCWGSLPIYKHWRAKKLLQNAQEYFQRGDYKNAILSVRASLDKRNDNPAADELFAEILESAGSANAVEWRQQVVNLLPNNVAAKIAFAKTAIRFNRPKIAATALEDVPASQQNQTDFLEVQAAIFTQTGNLEGAAKDYNQIIATSPKGKTLSQANFKLAQIWISSPLPGVSDKAVQMLTDLESDPDWGLPALRILLARAMKAGDYVAALDLSSRLVDLPKAEVEDYIHRVETLYATHSPLATSSLEWLKASVNRDPVKAARVADWILNKQGAPMAIAWLDSLPDTTKSKMPIPVIEAECYGVAGDWAALQKFVIGKNWDTLEPQRYALLAISYWGQKNEDLGKDAWGKALDAARDQPGVSTKLVRQAMDQHRPEEARDALWNVSATDPDHAWAQSQLFAYYRSVNDAPHLLKLLEGLLADHPSDVSTKSSIAALLLITGGQDVRAGQLAREIYQTDPKPVGNAAIYAYSLLLQGDSVRAASILDGYPPEEKYSDVCAVYYGLILAACGRDDEAQEAFKKMNRKILFPQMLAKVEAAEAKIKESALQAASVK